MKISDVQADRLSVAEVGLRRTFLPVVFQSLVRPGLSESCGFIM